MVLRPDGTQDDCHFPGDNDELTFHLGALIEKKLVSIASFYFENSPLLPEHQNQFRLRGMATVDEYRSKDSAQSSFNQLLKL